MSNPNRTVLFGEKAAGVYVKSSIFFPSDDGEVTPEESGTIVPAVGSIVIDDTIPGIHNRAYVVVAVDANNYYPTLAPLGSTYDATSQTDRVLSYGNDLLMLYYQSNYTIHRNGEDVNVTKLIVDNKLSIFGNHAATYQLFRYKQDGSLQVISKWYTPNGLSSGTAIPMLDTGIQGVRKCDGCYTDKSLKEGETIVCKIYAASGLQVSEVSLIAKEAHMLNEVANMANPIVDMTVNCNQSVDGNPDVFFLYEGQSARDLVFYPTLHYSDGSSRTISINNSSCFVYGLEDIDTSIPDMEYQLLFKYYLSDDDVNLSGNVRYVYWRTQDTEWLEGKTYYTRRINNGGFEYIERSSSSYTVGEAISSSAEVWERREVQAILEDGDESVSFITKFALVRVQKRSSTGVSKVALIPSWNQSAAKFEFRFAKYYESMNVSPNITGIVLIGSDDSYLDFVVEGYALDNLPANTRLKGKITYKENTGGGYIEQAPKYVWFKLNPDSFEKYLISYTEEGANVYGSNAAPHKRPRIVYGNGKYTIPSSIFAANSNATAKEVFLDNFYYQASPPEINNSIVVPTHFRVKNLNGDIITSSDVLIDNFSDAMTFTEQISINSTVVLEFLKKETVDQFGVPTERTSVIYGVPVEVLGSTGE